VNNAGGSLFRPSVVCARNKEERRESVSIPLTEYPVQGISLKICSLTYIQSNLKKKRPGEEIKESYKNFSPVGNDFEEKIPTLFYDIQVFKDHPV
jgi:hypothetical protein